jgi:hypothetical protein
MAVLYEYLHPEKVTTRKSGEVIEKQSCTRVKAAQLAFFEEKPLWSDRNWNHFTRPCGKRTQSFAEIHGQKCPDSCKVC